MIPAPRYAFSDRLDALTRRAPEAVAAAQAEILLRRLGAQCRLDELAEGSAARRLLVLFARDVLLAAQWYVEEEVGYVRRRQLLVAVAVGITLVAMVVTLVLSMFHITSALFEYGAAFVSLVVAVCLGGLRILGAADDQQARLAACAEVRAALTENIEYFEDTWRGKLTVPFGDGFLDALRTEIGKARAIVRDERRAYYAAQKSLDDVFSAAETQVTGVRAAALALVGLRAAEKKERRERTDEQRKAVGDLTREPGLVERELAAARRELEIEERRIDLLAAAGLDDAQLAAARLRRIDAQVLVHRLEAELRDARARIRIEPLRA